MELPKDQKIPMCGAGGVRNKVLKGRTIIRTKNESNQDNLSLGVNSHGRLRKVP